MLIYLHLVSNSFRKKRSDLDYGNWISILWIQLKEAIQNKAIDKVKTLIYNQ